MWPGGAKKTFSVTTAVRWDTVYIHPMGGKGCTDEFTACEKPGWQLIVGRDLT